MLRTVGYIKIPEDITIKCRIKSSDNPRLTKIVLGGACKIRDITTVINTAYALSSGTNSTRRGILAEHLAKQQVDLRPPQIEQITFYEKESESQDYSVARGLSYNHTANTCQ